MSNRYQVLDGSQSAHCCFEATVIDTQRPQMVCGQPFVYEGKTQYHAICECFETEDAELIAKALNEVEVRNENQ